MAYAGVESRQFGLKKESVRGTAEAAPSKWFPIDRDSALSYELALLPDQALRGVPDEFPSIAGPKNGSGKIKLPLDAQTVGEFFYSMLGANTPAQQGGSAAYLHTMLRDATSLQRPAYTFFMNYGNSIVKKYNLGVVKAISIQGVVGQLLSMEADVLFKSEVDGSIGSPAFPTQRYMGFNHVTTKIGGGANTDVRSFQVKMDGGSEPIRTLNQSQDITDILAKKRVDANGNFVIFFTSSTDRDAFLAGTTTSLEFLIEHSIIASTFKYTVDLVFPKIQYTAYPYGEQEDLLAATVNWAAKYDTATSRTMAALITNTDTSY